MSIMDKYNWEGINYPSEKDNQKNFEKNNLGVALNILYVKNEKIYLAYVSKQLRYWSLINTENLIKDHALFMQILNV